MLSNTIKIRHKIQLPETLQEILPTTPTAADTTR